MDTRSPALSDELRLAHGIDKLLRVTAQLRHPTDGCPWDLKQTHQSLKRYMLEEAYEAVEAMDASSPELLKEELGDVLLQVALHSRLAEEAGHFDFQDVCEAIAEKLIRRHPHVFGTAEVADAEAVTRQWAAIKQAEKAKANGAAADAPESILAHIAKHQPALSRALETSKRAVNVGFEWPNLDALWACVMSEYDEFRAETASLADVERPTPTDEQFDRLESEMGDILFATVNLARHFKIDPEVALTRATAKFTRRFQTMERLLTATSPESEDAAPSLPERMKTLDFAAWDELWNRAKAHCQAEENA